MIRQFLIYIFLISFGCIILRPSFGVNCSPIQKTEECCSVAYKVKKEKCHSQTTESSQSDCKQCIHIISVVILYFQNQENTFFLPISCFYKKPLFSYTLQELPVADLNIWHPPKVI